MRRRILCRAAATLVPALALITLPSAPAAPASAVAPATANHAAKQMCPDLKTRKWTCDIRAVTDETSKVRATPDFSGGGLTPLQLRSAYKLPYNGGKGQTVVIISDGHSPTAESDLAVYREQFGLPSCTTTNGCFRVVDKDYQTPVTNPGTSRTTTIETALDVDAVSATCPLCKIVVVETDAADQQSALPMFDGNYNAIHTGGAKYISNSWTLGSEYPQEVGDNAAWDNPGGAVTFATGDWGFAGIGGAGVGYPATASNVVAVGGTSLYPASNQRGWTESAWSGSGSGCSAYEPAPAWQEAESQAAGCNGHRVEADMAVAADPDHGGLAIYSSANGGWLQVGGTSEAAPIAATMFAMAGTSDPDGAASRLYSRPWAVNDVTTGSTGTCTPVILCTAGPGWDGPTGVGSPTSLALFNQ
ncbi:S8 family serine peptidase [Streptomyces sp. NPDC002573]|uniref:S53 family peptidase n=1 Tax=Streptomyces sp. NPDC002573 TaxID=3364651 RepID=UPI0036C5719B